MDELLEAAEMDFAPSDEAEEQGPVAYGFSPYMAAMKTQVMWSLCLQSSTLTQRMKIPLRDLETRSGACADTVKSCKQCGNAVADRRWVYCRLKCKI